jgi:hypothetical protein
MIEVAEFNSLMLYDIRQEALDSGISQEDAFFEWMANRLETEGEIATTDRVAFVGANSGKTMRIDGIGGHPREAEGVLSVMICNFQADNEPVKMNAQEAKKHFGHLVNFVTASRRDTFRSDLTDGSPEVGVADLIASAWKSITKVKLILITNAINSARTDAVHAGKIGEVPVTYNVWDLTRIHRYETSGQAREKIVVNFQSDFGSAVPALKASGHGEKLDSYLAVIRGDQLAEIYDKWGSRLLESNVRSFLQARGAVNRGIRDTIKDEPEMFFSYNNGLSATADSVEVEQTPDGLKLISASNLQVVNGGQTTASLHAARRITDEALQQVHVQMKLTIVPTDASEEIVPYISKYANSQNKVSAADFFSNHPFHIRIEEYSRRVLAPAAEGTNRETKWFYERARGQYQVERAKRSQAKRRHFDMEYPKKQFFVKTDLAKVEMSFRQCPDTVSKGAQKNFGVFAQDIGKEWDRSDKKFDETWFRRLVAKIIIFRHLEKVVPKQLWYPGGFRANIITYAISKFVLDVSDKKKVVDFDSVWQQQVVPQELSEALLLAAEAAAKVITHPEAGINNITEWAKKQACWALLQRTKVNYRKEILDCLIELEEAQTVQKETRQKEVMISGIEAQAKVVEEGGFFWKQLREWGTKKRMFSPKEDGILKSCSLLPAKLPSEKQAVIAIGLLEKALKEGYEDEIGAHKVKISTFSRQH